MGAFDRTVGVLILGLLGNTYLYGLVTYQFLVYQTTNFKDAFWVKSIVAALFLVDTAHSMVAVYAMWQLCIDNYGNPESLQVVGWTIPFTGVATSVSAILTQTFLAHRVFMLTKSVHCVAAIVLLSSLGFVFGVYSSIRAGIINKLVNFAALAPYVACWLGLQTSADILITVVLIYALARSRTGYSHTDNVINSLIRGTIQTGLFASLFTLANLFSFLWLRNTDLYAMFAYPLGRIYTNTLLDTLNSRVELKIMSANARDCDGRTD